MNLKQKSQLIRWGWILLGRIRGPRLWLAELWSRYIMLFIDDGRLTAHRSVGRNLSVRTNCTLGKWKFLYWPIKKQTSHLEDGGKEAPDNKFSKPKPRINIIIIIVPYLLFAIFSGFPTKSSSRPNYESSGHNFCLFHNKSWKIVERAPAPTSIGIYFERSTLTGHLWQLITLFTFRAACWNSWCDRT